MSGDHGYARFFAYLNYFVFSMLLLVLAANFVLLIVGWAFVGAASYLLISFWYRRGTATYAGIKAFVMNVIGDVGLVIAAFLLLDQTGQLDYLGVFERRPRSSRRTTRTIVWRLPLPPGRRVRQVRAAAAPHLAAGRHGGPDARLRPDPRGHDGHRGRLPDRAHASRSSSWRPTAADIGAVIGTATLVFAATVALVQTDLKRVIAYSTMSQIGYMVLGVSAAAYGAGPLPPDDARLLQGAPLHGRRLGDRRDGRHPEHGPDGRLPQGDAVHVHHLHDRRARAGRLPAHGGLVLEGRDPRLHAQPRRRLRGARRSRATSARRSPRFYAFRMVFRVFFGEPVPEAQGARGAATSPTASR